jgi:hypothetical protein
MSLKKVTDCTKPMRGRRYAVSAAKLMEYRKSGMSFPKIAAVYGCDQATVQYWFERLGLPKDRYLRNHEGRLVSETDLRAENSIAAAKHAAE